VLTIVPSKIIEDVTVFEGRVTVPVNVGEAKVAKPEIDAPAGIVTVPVNVGLASGAFRAMLFVSVVDRAASFPSAVAISPRVSKVALAVPTRFATSVRTNAVVAT